MRRRAEERGPLAWLARWDGGQLCEKEKITLLHKQSNKLNYLFCLGDLIIIPLSWLRFSDMQKYGFILFKNYIFIF